MIVIGYVWGRYVCIICCCAALFKLGLSSCTRYIAWIMSGNIFSTLCEYINGS